MEVKVGVSVGAGVKVTVNVGMEVNAAGTGVEVSAGKTPVDVEAGSGEEEAGVPPWAPKLQASTVNIRTMERIYFEFLMV